jgi:hypothetical protein
MLLLKEHSYVDLDFLMLSHYKVHDLCSGLQVSLNTLQFLQADNENTMERVEAIFLSIPLFIYPAFLLRKSLRQNHCCS